MANAKNPIRTHLSNRIRESQVEGGHIRETLVLLRINKGKVGKMAALILSRQEEGPESLYLGRARWKRKAFSRLLN